MTRPTKAYTHCGIFHSDDVFAAALLKTINPDIQIYRVNHIPDNMKNGDADTIVFDIGGGKYDHHTKDTQEFRDSVKGKFPYASFGKVFRDYFSLIDDNPDVFKIVDKNLVIGIDGHDCGALDRPNELAMAINSFNPTTDEFQSPEDINKAFIEAVKIAQIILRRHIAKAQAQVNSDSIVREALQKRNPIRIISSSKDTPITGTY